MNMYETRLTAVRERIKAAALASGRDPASIKLLAVSKQHPASAIRQLHSLGQADFGENRLPEALEKQAELEALGLNWHFIGQIQSNKTREIAAKFGWVQSADRDKILKRLSQQRPAALPPLNVCLQVNIDDEPQKAGARPDDIPDLAALTAQLPGLTLRGLMCLPEKTDDPARTEQSFLRLFALQAKLCDDGHSLDTLSMGMSGDLELAVRCGSTLLRVGTDLFGPRAAATPMAKGDRTA